MVRSYLVFFFGFWRLVFLLFGFWYRQGWFVYTLLGCFPTSVGEFITYLKKTCGLVELMNWLLTSWEMR